MKKQILVVAAHPDDEILGCGGTISRLIAEGNEISVLILGEGVTARDKHRSIENRKQDLNVLKKQSQKANSILSVNKVYFMNFPDNRFDSLPLIEIIKKIEEIKQIIKPEIIFTHYEKDLNIDHQITYKATITATRPIRNETVKEIYSFEILSSTEWSYPLLFSPNIFFEITLKDIENKTNAMKIYKNELNEWPHPRSVEAIKMNAKQWGFKSGFNYAEAFILVRSMKIL